MPEFCGSTTLSASRVAIAASVALVGALATVVLLCLALDAKSDPNLRWLRIASGIAIVGGGLMGHGIALVLALVAVVATFLVDVYAATITAGVFVVFIAYFWFYSRHHLVANAPEEEFALLQAAETKLH